MPFYSERFKISTSRCLSFRKPMNCSSFRIYTTPLTLFPRPLQALYSLATLQAHLLKYLSKKRAGWASSSFQSTCTSQRSMKQSYLGFLVPHNTMLSPPILAHFAVFFHLGNVVPWPYCGSCLPSWACPFRHQGRFGVVIRDRIVIRNVVRIWNLRNKSTTKKLYIIHAKATCVGLTPSSANSDQ